MKSLKVSLWIVLLISTWVWPVYALEEALGNPSTAVSSSVPTTDADVEKLLAAALQLRETKPELFDGVLGVLIVNVLPDSQAAEKGLRSGDIVIAYDGEPMYSTDQLIKSIQAKASKTQVVGRFIRGEKVEEMELKGGKMGIELRSIPLSPQAMEFVKQLQATIEANDDKKHFQLIRDNPKLAKQILPSALLVEIGQLRPELDCLQEEGEQARSQSNYPLAIKKWQEGLDQARQLVDKLYISAFLGNLGVLYDDLGQYPKALEYHQQALAIYKELGDKQGEGNNLNSLGNVYNQLGQYPKALEYYQQALDISREIGDKRGEGNGLGNLGVLYDDLGQYPKALEYSQQALAIHKELGDKNGEGSGLTNLGVVYQNLGQYPKALECYQQALAIDKELGDKRGEGNDLANLGNVYNLLGQYPKALEYYQQSLAIHQALGDKHGEGSDLTGLGVLYQNLGQHSKALEYYQQALSIDKKLGNKRGEGKDLANLGIVYENLGQYPKAEEHFQNALAIAKELGDKRGEGADLNNLGVIYKNSGQYPKALAYHQQALSIRREIGDKRGEGSGLGNLGVLYVNLGQYDEAKAHFQDSADIFESLGDLDDLWKAQGNIAAIEVRLKQPKDAIHHYEQTLDTIEQLRVSLTGGIEKATGLPARTLKSDFMQDKFIVYDELINLYHAQGEYQKAFETFERKQGRAFLEDMGKSTARRFTGVPEQISTQDRDLENQVAAARKNLGDAYAKGKDVDPSPFRQRLDEAEKAQQDFEEKLKTEYPSYYALKYPKPVKLDDLQKNVLQPDEIVLIYNVREEATDLWLVGQRHFQMVSLPLTEAQMAEQVAEFRKWAIGNVSTENLLKLSDSLVTNFDDFAQASHTLYQQLFPETVRTLLAEAKPKLLYIVPTSALYKLPFEALITENTDKPRYFRYLLEDYAVSYLSSASLLKTLRDAKAKSKDSQTRQKTRQPLLAFADPVYPPCSDKATTKGLETADSFAELQTKSYLKAVSAGCFPRLPGSAEEANEIADLLKVDKNSKPAPLQLRKDAAKSTVFEFNDKQQLDKYQYILFSTHAILPNEITFIQQPAIVLSHTQPIDENGFLTMGDVFGLSINTDLVMLSACNTGLGDDTIKGEGTIGLTRAFMYAGTPAVAITLWSVETNATKALNVGWFNRLQQKQPLAESLRQAKLAMIHLETEEKEDYYRYPYAWAGIVVFGDGK